MIPANLRLGASQALSQSSNIPNYEIPWMGDLPSGSTAKLASPQIHQVKGFNYPLWLDDAAFKVTQRPGQRATLLIAPQRTSPTEATELMVEVINNGSRRFIPYYLATDVPLSPLGSGLPAMPRQSEVLLDPLSAIQYGQAIDGSRLDTALPNGYPTSNTHPALVDSLTSARYQTQTQLKPTSKNDASTQTVPRNRSVPTTAPPQLKSPISTAEATAPATAVSTPATSASSEQPASSVQAPAAPVSTPTVSVTQALATPATAAPEPPKSNPWFLNQTVLAILGVVALLLLYILFRLWQRQRAVQALPNLQKSGFIDYPATAQGTTANTVFGLTNKEAEEMQRAWRNQNVLQK